MATGEKQQQQLPAEWKTNTGFADCTDIDIALSPFTNTLPINRLQLNDGEAAEVVVIYCNPLANEIKRVQQQYTKLAAGKFRYENIPKDFEAEISVDAYGLVTDYPQLFVRKKFILFLIRKADNCFVFLPANCSLPSAL